MKKFQDFNKNESELFTKNGAVLEFNRIEFFKAILQEKKSMTGSKQTEEEVNVTDRKKLKTSFAIFKMF